MSATARGKGWYWPLVVVGLLAASAGGNVWFMLLAAGDQSFAVEPDYYQKALRWDETMAQQARNAALGWSVAAEVHPARVAHGVEVGVRVSDRGGAPVDGARVTVEAFHSARAGQVFTAALLPRAEGVYGATLPGRRPGLWELRLRVERGEDVFTQTLTRELAIAR
jgi:nitrogen fixation protein FixH